MSTIHKRIEGNEAADGWENIASESEENKVALDCAKKASHTRPEWPPRKAPRVSLGGYTSTFIHKERRGSATSGGPWPVGAISSFRGATSAESKGSSSTSASCVVRMKCRPGTTSLRRENLRPEQCGQKYVSFANIMMKGLLERCCAVFLSRHEGRAASGSDDGAEKDKDEEREEEEGGAGLPVTRMFSFFIFWCALSLGDNWEAGDRVAPLWQHGAAKLRGRLLVGA